MRTFAGSALLALALVGESSSPARPDGERADLIVAADGSGDFRTIQAALDALPREARGPRIVLIRNGTYREKLFLTKSQVALVGEDRRATRIVFAELRSCHRDTRPDDWGAAVLNIADGVSDVTLANLTIWNDAGRVYGSDDHQFAVRSGAGTTRIATLGAVLGADGGDTVSLWNGESGLFFHADCDFEGHVDFVCPRGDAWVTDSRFFCRSLTAALWHDGSANRERRFAVRNSRFDGVPGFALGRFTRDGQIYLVDCAFAKEMADRAIYLAREPSTFAWGLRAFYARNHREGGDYAWHKDNLPDGLRADDLTPAWVFGDRWDPENELPPVLPYASLPRPRHAARNVPAAGVPLVFTPGRNATAHEVSFGEEGRPARRTLVPGSRLGSGTLRPGTRYVWSVTAITKAGRIPGPEWRFETQGLGPAPALTSSATREASSSVTE